NRVGAGDIRGVVSHCDPRTEGFQPACRSARREIGARDLVALRGEHFGDAAHAGTSDADEMHALDLVLHRLGSNATQASATRSAASVRPTLRAAIAIAASRSR